MAETVRDVVNAHNGNAVLVIRHADYYHPFPGDEAEVMAKILSRQLPDELCQISNRGGTTSFMQGNQLRKWALVPNTIIVSPSIRAIGTGLAIHRGLGETDPAVQSFARDDRAINPVYKQRVLPVEGPPPTLTEVIREHGDKLAARVLNGAFREIWDDTDELVFPEKQAQFVSALMDKGGLYIVVTHWENILALKGLAEMGKGCLHCGLSEFTQGKRGFPEDYTPSPNAGLIFVAEERACWSGRRVNCLAGEFDRDLDIIDLAPGKTR